MALPVTVVSTGQDVKFRALPVISSAGNVYVICKNGSGGISCYKATDPTSSFSEADSAGSPAGTNTRTIEYVQDSDLLHVVSARTSAQGVEYHKFNMATDSWDTIDEQIRGTGMSNPTNDSASIVHRSVSGDELVVFINGEFDTVMGTDYQRVDAYHKNKTASTWTGPIAVDSAGEVNYSGPASVLGASNRSHVAYDVDASSGTVDCRTLDSSNSLSTVASSTSNYDVRDAANPFSVSLSFDEGGTQVIRWVSGLSTPALFMCKENATTGDIEWEATETVSIVDSSPNARALTCAWDSTDGDMHALFSNSSLDIGYDVSTNGGSTWTTDTTEYNDASNAFRPHCNIFTRSGNIKLAYTYDTGTATKYHEKDLGAAPAATRRIFLIS